MSPADLYRVVEYNGATRSAYIPMPYDVAVEFRGALIDADPARYGPDGDLDLLIVTDEQWGEVSS